MWDIAKQEGQDSCHYVERVNGPWLAILNAHPGLTKLGRGALVLFRWIIRKLKYMANIHFPLHARHWPFIRRVSIKQMFLTGAICCALLASEHLLQSAATKRADVATVFSPEQMEKIIRQLPTLRDGNQILIDGDHYAVSAARITNRNGDPEYHTNTDDVFYVLSGSAKLRLGGEIVAAKQEQAGEFTGKSSRGWHEVPLTAGSVITIPRMTVHQVMASDMDVTYLVIKAR